MCSWINNVPLHAGTLWNGAGAAQYLQAAAEGAQMYIIANNRCHCYANKNGLYLQLLVVSASTAQSSVRSGELGHSLALLLSAASICTSCTCPRPHKHSERLCKVREKLGLVCLHASCSHRASPWPSTLLGSEGEKGTESSAEEALEGKTLLLGFLS